MPRAMKTARTTLLSLAVLGALGFGASAAVAGPMRLPECTDPEANGPCGTDSGCRSYCDRLFGPGTGGFCNENSYCCYCLFSE